MHFSILFCHSISNFSGIAFKSKVSELDFESNLDTLLMRLRLLEVSNLHMSTFLITKLISNVLRKDKNLASE